MVLASYHMDTFYRLDRDGNGKLSQEEYLGSLSNFQDKDSWWLRSIFSQADIDDDDQLCLQEFQFSLYLGMADRYDGQVHEKAHLLPEGYLDQIDYMFADLVQGSAGKTSLRQIQDCFANFLRRHGQDIGSEDDDVYLEMGAVFAFADVIPDGVLNRNEMEFLHFMVKEALIEAALIEHIPDYAQEVEIEEAYKEHLAKETVTQKAPPTAKQEKAKAKEKHEAWAKFLDGSAVPELDGDGKLSEERFTSGVRGALVESALDEALVMKYLLSCFKDADANGDGSLDAKEREMLIDKMLRTMSPR